MKKFLALILLLTSVCASAQIDKVVPKKPVPARLVNDFTGTLTHEQADALERKLYKFDDSTTNQVAIVIIPTVGDYGPEEVALQIMREWGVGSKEKNNGIVILVSKNDRKIRIEVGYGLEGAVPDLTARNIIENDIRPAFREGNFYRGLDRATDNIIKATTGEYKAPANYNKNKIKKSIGIGAVLFFIIMIVIFIIIGARGGGGGGGGMISRRGWGDVGTAWLLGSLLGGASRGGGGGWSGGGGGWSGGGGFGGFGGGSGGGGGASGSW